MPEREQVTMVKEGLLSLVQSSRPGKACAEEKGRRSRRGRLERRRRAAAAATAVAWEKGREEGRRAAAVATAVAGEEGKEEGEDMGLQGGIDAGFAAIDESGC